jgi:hypothetical protein
MFLSFLRPDISNFEEMYFQSVSDEKSFVFIIFCISTCPVSEFILAQNSGFVAYRRAVSTGIIICQMLYVIHCYSLAHKMPVGIAL